MGVPSAFRAYRAGIGATATPRGPTSASRPSPASARPATGIGLGNGTTLNVRPASVLAATRPPASARTKPFLPSAAPATIDAGRPGSTLDQVLPSSPLRYALPRRP